MDLGLARAQVSATWRQQPHRRTQPQSLRLLFLRYFFWTRPPQLLRPPLSHFLIANKIFSLSLSLSLSLSGYFFLPMEGILTFAYFTATLFCDLFTCS
jgi:hypothetical protein